MLCPSRLVSKTLLQRASPCKGLVCSVLSEPSATEPDVCNGPSAAASLGIRGALLVYFLGDEFMRPLHLPEKAAMLGSLGFDLIWNLGLSPYVDNWCAHNPQP